MKVEIWSDIMCPFCYIGKRNFESALKEWDASHQIEIIWKSFQLDPSIPERNENNVTSIEYLSSRKGINPEDVKQIHLQVTQTAKEAGLDYHLDHTALYNSFKAHRIIQLAKTKGLGDLAEETFFYAHFTENKDLGHEEVLKELSKKIGLTEKDFSEALSSSVYAEKVNQDIREAHQIGVTGVPFFVFDRKYGVSGAQPPAVFLETLKKSYSEWSKKNPVTELKTTNGSVCTPDGTCK